MAVPARAEWHLQWRQTLPPRVAAWEFVPKMERDAGYQITPVGGLAVVTTEFDGSVRAFDTASGREQWRFHTNGPIRSAAVAGADDWRQEFHDAAYRGSLVLEYEEPKDPLQAIPRHIGRLRELIA